MENLNIATGSEVLIKHSKQGRFQHHGYSYDKAVVTRTTKTRIFVKRLYDGAPEVAFTIGKSGYEHNHLQEYGKTYNPDSLVIDAEKIAKALADEATEKALKALQGTALRAILDLRKAFDDGAIYSRTGGELQAVIAAVKALGYSKE